ncbi:MAG: 3-phosphoserine/phosphohydroxythreonine transaminase [Bacteroidia bacterium]|nr:3-phosphoserine/phosphohydroxythreonine transaminase [Bacteroidia bacterium]
MSKVYNFSAGPAVLPQEVLREAQEEFLDYRGTGMSVMEMSHRESVFIDIMERAEASLRQLMAIPDSYEVLFLQGGTSFQFAMVPLNLFRKSHRADFVRTGTWAEKAIEEASRYGKVQVVASSEDANYTYYPDLNPADFDPEADYFHITTNNTIFGTRISQLPTTGNVPLVADMSSNILSEHYRVEDFGLIYAGAQKNIGPAGLTLAIIRKDLIGHAMPFTPVMLNYHTHASKKSAYNTPPTFAVYMAGRVFDWTIRQGGVAEMERRNIEKSALLYNYLDNSDFYRSPIRKKDRSRMNVPFKLVNESLDKKFIAEAAAAGLSTLQGHRSVGGMRASLYNPMPLEGVEALVDFMDNFRKYNS